ncbi:hypothetical protein KXV92_006171 [Aspergillus fumigatus]|nr:hypothetical protein KXV47_001668 [Aspergillus fumigatus]KAH3113774.1 hypothetical protein KXX00_000925 [Aspergillus fumigatus]KAH3185340.1 hypothetical protein KXV92_006171 [Aspergillus fumigatus]
MSVEESIAPHVASAASFRSWAIQSQSCGVCLYHFSHTISETWAITGGTNVEEPPPLAFHLEICHYTFWCSSDVFASNDSGAAQAGVLPSVPGGMAVGATRSGVPPGVSASNDSGAAQAGVLPRDPCGMTVGATSSGVPPGISASNGFEAPRPGASPVPLAA